MFNRFIYFSFYVLGTNAVISHITWLIYLIFEQNLYRILHTVVVYWYVVAGLSYYPNPKSHIIQPENKVLVLKLLTFGFAQKHLKEDEMCDK